MSYYIAILYNKTLKKDLQKKKVCSKSSAKQKKCAAKGLQNEKKKVNPCQYPQQLQGGACNSTVYPVVLQRNATQFLPTSLSAVANKWNHLINFVKKPDGEPSKNNKYTKKLRIFN